MTLKGTLRLNILNAVSHDCIREVVNNKLDFDLAPG